MNCKICGRPLGITDVDFEQKFGIHAGPREHREHLSTGDYERLVELYKKRK
jgi:hypothetical protein